MSRNKNLRSRQFYATRCGFDWRFHEKTRDVIAVLQKHFGTELDAVTLIGLRAQPASRDWRRFLETYEIVDLGRRRDTGMVIFGELKAQAADERRRQEIVSSDPLQIIRERCEWLRRRVTEMRERVSACITDSGLYPLCVSHNFALANRDTLQDLAVAELVWRGSEQLMGWNEPTAWGLRFLINEKIADLKNRAAHVNGIGREAGNFWLLAWENAELRARRELIAELTQLRQALDNYENAKRVEDQRTSDP